MRCPTLSELPPPPSGKTGWPWTQASPQLPDQMPDGAEWTKISIVTPNYNYGRFIEETIRSVLLQGYPNLEYIVIDGDSTDESVEIIKKYEPWLTYWVSEKDKGQANAINRGINLATGEWFNWLNSDDILLPNAFLTLVKISQLVDNPKWISGARLQMSEDGLFRDRELPWIFDPSIIGLGQMSFPQDSTFINLRFIQENKLKLNEDLNNVFDTVFYYQLSEYVKPLLTTAIFSAMRLHKMQKTADTSSLRSEQKEILQYVQKLPLINRVILRCLRTRLQPLVKAILLVIVFYGLLPESRTWLSVAFDTTTNEFKIVESRLFLL
jgi:glycosyltransferase involved in cell wall biosynthesis